MPALTVIDRDRLPALWAAYCDEGGHDLPDVPYLLSQLGQVGAGACNRAGGVIDALGQVAPCDLPAQCMHDYLPEALLGMLNDLRSIQQRARVLTRLLEEQTAAAVERQRQAAALANGDCGLPIETEAQP